MEAYRSEGNAVKTLQVGGGSAGISIPVLQLPTTPHGMDTNDGQ